MNVFGGKMAILKRLIAKTGIPGHDTNFRDHVPANPMLITEQANEPDRAYCAAFLKVSG